MEEEEGGIPSEENTTIFREVVREQMGRSSRVGNIPLKCYRINAIHG